MNFAYNTSLNKIVLCLIAFFYSCEVEQKQLFEDAEPEFLSLEPAGLSEIIPDAPPKETVYDIFGFEVDSFNVEKRNVRRNENLSVILQGQGVSHAQIHNISQASQ